MELIVAFDASDESKSALKSAIELAKRTDADVTAVHSIQQTVSETETDRGYPIIEGFDDADERGKRVLDDARHVAESADFDITTDVTYGDPVNSVIEYVSDSEDSAIFVGHRAIAAQKSAVGSVAQGLIRESPVPVTVVN